MTIPVELSGSGLTSGVIGTQYLDVTSVIEKAARRAGVMPGKLSAESMAEANSELFLSMSALINDGAPLWTVTKQIYGLNYNQNLLPLTTGTIDIQNILYRYNVLPSGGTPYSSAGGVAANAFDQNLTDACTQTSPNGYISYDFGASTPVTITTAGIYMNSTQTLNPIYEYSTNGTTWITAVPTVTQATSYVKGNWYWVDVPSPVNAEFFRVRETSGGTLDVNAVVFGQAATEVIVSRTNKDDYQNLPNKNLPGSRPLQYWFDRQIQPQLWLWPVSNYAFNTLVIWRRRELQDVGSFTNILEFPNRWMDAVVADLAQRLVFILPEADLKRAPLLAANATQAMTRAWAEERDKSPIYYSSNISYYTSGGG